MESLLPIVFFNKIRAKANRDNALGRIFNYVKYGFPNKLDVVFKSFFYRKDELSLENGIIMQSYTANSYDSAAIIFGKTFLVMNNSHQFTSGEFFTFVSTNSSH